MSQRTIEDREKEFAKKYVEVMGKYLIDTSKDFQDVYEVLCIIFGRSMAPEYVFWWALCEGHINQETYDEARRYYGF